MNQCKASDRKDRCKWLPEDTVAVADDEANAMDFVFSQYPRDDKVGDIPLQDENDRIALAESLREHGLCIVSAQTTTLC